LKRIKILYIISGINYSLGFDWLDKYLDHSKYEVSYVFISANRPDLYELFEQRKRNVFFVYSKSKANYPKAFLNLMMLIRKIQPTIVHCHLFEANLLGMTAAFLMRTPKRIYTRHHSTYHFDYAPKMVKFDRLINKLSTHIASISENVSSVLIEKEQVKRDKIYLVNHGFELETFSHPQPSLVSEMKCRYNPDEKYPVIGVISRFTEWKGIQYIIPAFMELLKSYPNALMILANANGDYSKQLNAQLKELPANSYLKIGFEKDISTLYQLFNIFVHVPIDAEAEAFGQTYVEALAAGVPSVFTLSGIAREFIEQEKNAIVVPFKNSDAIFEGISRLLEDEKLSSSLSTKGRRVVESRFKVEVMMSALYKMYES
jgi:glycosyltransferase involved in cell wall biosynthesis